jgi:hypothetical protein
VISGILDANGDMPTIEGGEWPSLVDAVDAHVTIKGFRLVRPKAGAIWIYAVSGLAVTGCRVESVEPSATFGNEAGQPGPLAFLNNDIDVGGTPGIQTLGIVMFSVGRSPDKEVNLNVSGNKIRNVTEPAINFRYVGGRARAEQSVIRTGVAAGG